MGAITCGNFANSINGFLGSALLAVGRVFGATGAGVLDTAQWPQSDGLYYLYVGAMYGGGTTFNTRDYAYIGHFSGSGTKTVTGLSIDCELGDFPAVQSTSQPMSPFYGRNNTGDGYAWKSGVIFGAGEQTGFTAVANREIGLLLSGTGSDTGGGALVGRSALVGGQILCGNGPLIN